MCKDHETLDCNFCGATVELILSVGMETVMMMQKELFCIMRDFAAFHTRKKVNLNKDYKKLVVR